ncbi:hypothetical protein BASA62_005768 [Batrachochytrium salamandrivorans]|nr:hypothetical protein BASA62_005768 [Batrachochytrium salamandrivorans]
MKLAIASTTLLFAMMAAQAAVLLVTSSTGVNLANLVKHAPNGGGKTRQKRMVGRSSLAPTRQIPFTRSERSQMGNIYKEMDTKRLRLIGPLFNRRDEIKEYKSRINKLQNQREGKFSYELIDIDKGIVTLEEVLVDLEQQFRAKRVERQKYLDAFLDIKRARRLQDYNYLRMAYLQNQ